MDMVLPMNTGAEAVETAVKVARKWGYDVKGVARRPGHDRRRGGQLPRPDHDDRQLLHRPRGARRLRAVHARASASCRTATRTRCEAAIDDTTVAVLIEPIQGEAGVLIPPAGYLRGVREICTPSQRPVDGRRDPVRARAHRPTFACEHEDVVPDVYVLGKALGGGIVPVSAVVVQPRGPRRADARARTGPRSAATRWPCAVGARGRRAARRPASSRRAPPAGRAAPRAACEALVGRGVTAGARPRPVGRPRHRPRADAPAGSSASG